MMWSSISNRLKVVLVVLVLCAGLSTVIPRILFSTSNGVTINKLRSVSLFHQEKGYFLEKCNCTKHRSRKGSFLGSEITSGCSEEADWLGGEQNIVSFSLHEEKGKILKGDSFDTFVRGIMSNVNQVQRLYPGWIVRIYSDHELDEELCPFACLNTVTWCDVRISIINNLQNLNSRMWRFMPLADPTVKQFVSRDIDSFICEREREAVEDWEASDKGFHIMRDNSAGHPRSILAGIWGAKNYVLGQKADLLRDELLRDGMYKTDFRIDEKLLHKFLFKKYPKDILAHDSYTCKRYPVPSVPYPKQRRNIFTRIALSIRVKHNFRAPKCPPACRPSYGKNWTYC